MNRRVQARVRPNNKYGVHEAGAIVEVFEDEITDAPWCLERVDDDEVADDIDEVPVTPTPALVELMRPSSADDDAAAEAAAIGAFLARVVRDEPPPDPVPPLKPPTLTQPEPPAAPTLPMQKALPPRIHPAKTPRAHLGEYDQVLERSVEPVPPKYPGSARSRRKQGIK